MKKLFSLILVLGFCFNLSVAFAETENENSFVLTAEEEEYIAENPKVIVVFLEGIAPLAYMEDGVAKGVAVEFYKEIGRITGLELEFFFFSNLPDLMDFIAEADGDLIGCASPQHVIPGLEENPRSKPFINCKTILYVNDSINTDDLSDKRYAAITGIELPEGVNKEKVSYFTTREASLRAVNDGHADYGYGNEYSVSFYTVQKGLQNIAVIPMDMDSRNYSAIYYNTNPTFVGIIDKVIESFDANTMQSIILRGTTYVQKNVTMQQVFSTFGSQIIIAVAIVFLVLCILIFLQMRSKKKYALQCKRLETLSEISDEYIYAYEFKTQMFESSKKTRVLLNKFKELDGCKIPEAKLFSLKEADGKIQRFIIRLISVNAEDNEVNFEMKDGSIKTFRIVNAKIDDSFECVEGKLTDISKEVLRREELIKKAEVDSMTGILNKTTFTKKAIQSLNNSPTDSKMIIFDIDNFKMVNDTYGHLTGDMVIETITGILIEAFPEAELIGRVGGDEFCIFIRDVDLTDIENRLTVLSAEGLQKNFVLKRYNIGMSYGIASIQDIDERGTGAYEAMYSLADKNLYQHKNIKKIAR